MERSKWIFIKFGIDQDSPGARWEVAQRPTSPAPRCESHTSPSFVCENAPFLFRGSTWTGQLLAPEWTPCGLCIYWAWEYFKRLRIQDPEMQVKLRDSETTWATPPRYWWHKLSVRERQRERVTSTLASLFWSDTPWRYSEQGWTIKLFA